MQLNIEHKEDSSDKLASISGKPTKNYLFGDELNEIVAAININGVKAVPYQTGLVISERTIVIYGNDLYLVSDTATLPFTCTNFAAELTAGTWRVILVPEASETQSGIVNTGSQSFAGNKSFKGESSLAGNALTVKNSSDQPIMQLLNDGKFILGNGTSLAVSDFLRMYDPSGNLKLRFFGDTFMFGNNSATVQNSGAGGMTFLGNQSLHFRVANKNIGVMSFAEAGEQNFVAYNSTSKQFYQFRRGWQFLGGSNVHASVLNVDGNFDFTGSNNNATALYVNPVLTGNSLNDFMAIWAVKGGAFFNTSTPAPSAILQADSTTQGSLPFPRMTETQKNAISSPAIGLHVYQTDGTEGVYVYKSSGWTFAY